MRVTKVFNNNVLLAQDDAGADVVLMGKGIGFQVRAGDPVREDDVERTFVAGGSTTPEHIVALLEDIPATDLDLTQRLVDEARAELGPHITGHVLMPLADHISFALRRARAGTEISYPLQWEVLHLYPREVACARRCLAVVASVTGVSLPALEAVPLALHFVNAQLGGGGGGGGGAGGEMARTFEMTSAIAAVLGVVRALHGCVLDEESLEVARFVTHLRYLFVRQARGEAWGWSGGGAAVREAVRGEHPRAFASAVAVAEVLRGRFGWEVGGEEEVWLALHVARLTGPGHQLVVHGALDASDVVLAITRPLSPDAATHALTGLEVRRSEEAQVTTGARGDAAHPPRPTVLAPYETTPSELADICLLTPPPGTRTEMGES